MFGDVFKKIILPGGKAAAKKKSIDDSIGIINSHLSEENFSCAESEALRLTDCFPKNSRIMRKLSQLYRLMGDGPSSKVWADKCSDQDGQNILVLLNLIEAEIFVKNISSIEINLIKLFELIGDKGFEGRYRIVARVVSSAINFCFVSKNYSLVRYCYENLCDAYMQYGVSDDSGLYKISENIHNALILSCLSDQNDDANVLWDLLPVSEEEIYSGLDFGRSLRNLVSVISSGEKYCFLNVVSLKGSQKHYHHFFASVIIPIMESFTLGCLIPGTRYFVPCCGPMNKEVNELAELIDIEFVILHPCTFTFISENLDSFNEAYIQLPSYDLLWRPGFELQSFSVSNIRNEFNKLFFSDERDEQARVKKSVFTVSIVDRVPPDRKYHLQGGKRTGSMRRSIPNLDVISEKLKTISEDVAVELLVMDDMGMREKARRLKETDIFILQHGAAVNNLWFLPPNSMVIEIIPMHNIERVSGIRRVAGFIPLYAKMLELRYLRVIQKDHHAPVNPLLIKNICLNIYERENLESDIS